MKSKLFPAIALIGGLILTGVLVRFIYNVRNPAPAPAATAVVELTDKNFEQEVVRSATPVYVLFYASQTPPEAAAQMAAQTAAVDALVAHYSGKVKIARLDVSVQANLQIALAVGIRVVPTHLVFVPASQALSGQEGIMSEADLKTFIDGALAPAPQPQTPGAPATPANPAIFDKK